MDGLLLFLCCFSSVACDQCSMPCQNCVVREQPSKSLSILCLLKHKVAQAFVSTLCCDSYVCAMPEEEESSEEEVPPPPPLYPPPEEKHRVKVPPPPPSECFTKGCKRTMSDGKRRGYCCDTCRDRQGRRHTRFCNENHGASGPNMCGYTKDEWYRHYEAVALRRKEKCMPSAQQEKRQQDSIKPQEEGDSQIQGVVHRNG